jgi:hypothetical protein
MSATAASAATAMQEAFLARDFSHASDRLADEVVLHSPVLEQPWRGRTRVEQLGPAMVAIFEDVAFGPVVVDGDRAYLSFTGRCEGVDTQALETLDVDADGRIAALTIYIRPLPALLAVARGMQARIDPELLAGHTTA